MNSGISSRSSLSVAAHLVGLCVILCLASVWPTCAQPLPPARLETNAWQIDYSHPEKYLAAGTQTALTSHDWATIEPELQLAPVDLASLKQLFLWKSKWFKSVNGGGRFVGRHNMQDLLRDRRLTGCHDHGLVVVSVLRHCGVPSVFVDATGIEWALDYPEKTKSFRGHVFVEIYLNKAWMLLDSVSGEYISNYSPLNPLIPLKKRDDLKGFYVMFKGLDPADYGITRIEHLTNAQISYARLIRTEIHGFHYPDYVIRRL